MTPAAVPVAPPLAVDLHGWHLEAEGGLGARGLVYVGDDADLVARDPFATEGVDVFPAALGLRLVYGPWRGELRVEEGSVHAGGLELATARVGAEVPGGWAEGWLGRGDVHFSADRAVEPEDLGFSVRPAASRAWLPQHATGGGAALAWPERALLEVGASWASMTADAPYLLARIELSPLGETPRRAATWTDGPRITVGGAYTRLDSEALGVQWGWTADLSGQWGPVGLRAGWVAGEIPTPIEEQLLELDLRVFPRGVVSPVFGVRGERVVGLAEGEDARWIAAGRLAMDAAGRRVSGWIEAHHAIEVGSAVSAGEDVVVLDASIERANDVALVGLALHL